MMLDDILREHSASFVVNRPFPSGDCSYHKVLTSEAKLEILASTRRIFLVGPDFSRELLHVRMQHLGPEAGKFFIDETKGGPSVSLRMCPQFQEDDVWWFGEASLHLRSTFWKADDSGSYPASSKAKKAFIALRGAIKRRLHKRIIGGATVWLSDGVIELFDSGKAGLAVAGGRCYTSNGQTPPPAAWRRKPAPL